MEQHNYSVGDVVNGHVWTGAEWVPVNYAAQASAGGQYYRIGAVVNGHRWDGSRWIPLPTAATGQAAVSRPWYSTTVGIIGIVTASVLAVLLLGVASTLGPDGPATVGSSNSATSAGSASGEAPPADGTTRVNQWSVKVVELDPDATGAILDENFLNPPPQHQYVVVTLEGTNGAASIKNLQSFTVKLQGSDRVVYRDDSFLMVMPEEFATEAAPGGTVKAQFLFDAPASALGPGAVILVDGVEVAIPRG